MIRTILLLQIIMMIAVIKIFAGNKTGMDRPEFSNPVFAFNNSFFKNGETIRSYDTQAKLLKEYGFDGIEHRETKGILELKEALDKEGLNIYADYLAIDIDNDQPYLAEWKEMIPKLAGTGIILWVHIHSEKFAPSDENADELIVPILQELADLANPYGVRIAIYHHVNLVAEKVEDSFRLAKKANRENVGSVFNLCHFLKTDSEENLKKVIDLTIPKLFAVSVCGADYGNTQKMGWDQLIQPLGEGTFDVYRLMEYLVESGFDGPVGVQCYLIPGEPEEYLAKSGKAWAHFKQRYGQKTNSLSREEKKDGWELLFDGKSADGWRGINQKYFPESGWKIEKGALVTCAADGAESGNGGDIISKQVYENFILKWEWKMDSKGGNSGLKYYVREGIGENSKYGYGLEYQILDDNNHAWMLSGEMKPNDYHTVGSMYELYPASENKRANPLGLWNQSIIVCNKNRIEHWLNGARILECDRSSEDFKERIAASKFKDVDGFGLLPEGHILLQDHGSIVHFRNIIIKEL